MTDINRYYTALIAMQAGDPCRHELQWYLSVCLTNPTYTIGVLNKLIKDAS